MERSWKRLSKRCQTLSQSSRSILITIPSSRTQSKAPRFNCVGRATRVAPNASLSNFLIKSAQITNQAIKQTRLAPYHKFLAILNLFARYAETKRGGKTYHLKPLEMLLIICLCGLMEETLHCLPSLEHLLRLKMREKMRRLWGYAMNASSQSVGSLISSK